jgi:penicillin-binding protein 2
VHGATDLHKGISESCNVYFYTLATEYGVGMDVIAEMGLRYGLGQKTGLGVNAEASGRMPTKAWMTLHNKGHFQLGYGLNAAIGQGATTVTVLQLALAYAALANGGTLYQPQLVRAVETSNGDRGAGVQPARAPADRHPAREPGDGAKGPARGVNEEGGTAFRASRGANFVNFDMAGKTGTAQVSHHLARGAEAERVWYFNREHAWFAGYAPVKSPEVAVVALVEHGGAGGKHAAPIAFEAVRAYQELVRDRRDGSRAGAKGPVASRRRPARREQAP